MDFFSFIPLDCFQWMVQKYMMKDACTIVMLWSVSRRFRKAVITAPILQPFMRITNKKRFCTIYDLAFAVAVNHGFTACAKLLLKNISEEPNLAALVAARKGHTELFKWLVTRPVLFQWDAMSCADDAARGDHPDTLQQIFILGAGSLGDNIIERLYFTAAKNRSVRVLDWLFDCGYALPAGLVEEAACGGRISLEWIAKCEPYARLDARSMAIKQIKPTMPIELAIHRQDWDSVRYLAENHWPWPLDRFLLVCENNPPRKFLEWMFSEPGLYANPSPFYVTHISPKHQPDAYEFLCERGLMPRRPAVPEQKQIVIPPRELSKAEQKRITGNSKRYDIKITVETAREFEEVFGFAPAALRYKVKVVYSSSKGLVPEPRLPFTYDVSSDEDDEDDAEKDNIAAIMRELEARVQRFQEETAALVRPSLAIHKV